MEGGSCIFDGWKIYPANLEDDFGLQYDLAFLADRLKDDSNRLFSDQKIDVTFYRTPYEHEPTSSCNSIIESHENQAGNDACSDARLLRNQAMNIASFMTLLGTDKTKSANLFYILRQENTWSRFNITEEACRKLLTCLRVYPVFLECLHSFGYKTDEDSRVWDGFHAHVSKKASQPAFEMCYTLRYIERKMVGTSTQWVLRQTGVYQKVHIANGRSTWLLLQPPLRFTQLLEKTRLDCHDGGRSKALHLHTLLISTALNNVPEYLEHLQSKITQLNYKACFSTVGTKKIHDFALTFADIQRLQLLRQEAIRLSTALRSLVKIIRDMKTHYITYNGLHKGVVLHDVLLGLNICRSRLVSHDQRLGAMIKSSEEISGLLSNILQFRHDEVLLHTSVAMQCNLDILRQIAFESKEENRNLSEIAKQNSKDSKAVKSLTAIATMYLPASLIATIFSSSLVQLAPINESIGRGHLRFSRDFWVYVLLSGALMLVTLSIMLALQGRLRMRFKKKPTN